MKKTFDCVDMKGKGQEVVRERLTGLSPEQRRAFWEQETQKLRDLQDRVRREKKKPA